MRTAFLPAIVLSACSSSSGVDTNPVIESRPTIHEAFAPRLLEIATTYNLKVQDLSQNESSEKAWTRLGDVARWAPTMCIGPPPPNPLLSDSSDEDSHGRKLYFLHTLDVAGYRAAADHDQPIGQAFVKESYEARRVEGSDADSPKQASNGTETTRKGKHWRLGPARDLFVMYKLHPATADTDQGWVYGTVTPELEVTSAGRVASCMECHVDARRDRMFGAKAVYEVASSGWDAWDLPEADEEE